MAVKERKIFIVDDDPVHAQMLRDHLHNNVDAKVTYYTNAEDCFNNMNQHPDVVFCDYYLDAVQKQPVSGVELLKKIKSKYPDTEVIMLSANDSVDMVAQSMKFGAFDYVLKNEHSPIKTEGKIHRILHYIRIRDERDFYKSGFYFLLTLVLLMIIALVVLGGMGYLDVDVQNPVR